MKSQQNYKQSKEYILSQEFLDQLDLDLHLDIYIIKAEVTKTKTLRSTRVGKYAESSEGPANNMARPAWLRAEEGRHM